MVSSYDKMLTVDDFVSKEPGDDDEPPKNQQSQ